MRTRNNRSYAYLEEKSMKKIVALLLSVSVLAGVLSACKKSDKTTETTTEGLGTDQSIEVTSDDSETDASESGDGEEGGLVHNNPNDQLEDGARSLDEHFDYPEEFSWGSYAEGGTFTIEDTDGQLVVDISVPGNKMHSCQVSKDGFAIYKGAKYQLEFDIKGDIERTFEWRIQLNGGDYHAYCGNPTEKMTTEMTHITAEFTMYEPSDPSPRFAFNFGDQGDCNGQAHKIYIDNVVLTILDSSAAEDIEPPPEPNHMGLNQVGYRPDDNKVVFVYNNEDETFDIVNAETNEVVYTGNFGEKQTARGASLMVTPGDFSDFKEPGTYILRTATYGDSYKFTIADNVYDDALKASILMLYTQRCGCEVTDCIGEEYADFTHPVCHDAEAVIYGTDQKIDVSGGWHDAGDFGRYVVPGAKTIEDLFMTYEDLGYKADDLGIPESGNGVPDLLDEARYELEWMLKMQAENGGVYHKVTCANFPGTVKPNEETEQLIVLPISTTATGDFAAIMAKASVVYKSIDADFANTCLEASKKAYGYMEANAASDTTGFLNPSDVFTGEYPDAGNKDEFFWAAMELYLATGEASYLDKAKELYSGAMELGLGWIEMGFYGVHAYLTADASLATDAEFTETLKARVLEKADTDMMNANRDGYFSPMGANYPWGSNLTISNNAIVYNLAYKLTGNQEYKDLADYQVDYIMGMNVCGYSFLTGFGEHASEFPHHRPSQVAGHAVPGMVVGGPNGKPEDPYALSLLTGMAPARCYCDNDTAYSINEVAIYWNSPFIYVLAAKVLDA